MLKYEQQFAEYKSKRNRLWWVLILLLPFLLCSLWIVYFSFLAIYRAFPEMIFGHGVEVLWVLPLALACIGIEIHVVVRLHKTKLSLSSDVGI